MQYEIFSYKYNSKKWKYLKELINEFKNKSFIVFWVKVKKEISDKLNKEWTYVKIFNLSKSYIWYKLSLIKSKDSDLFLVDNYLNWSFINKNKIEMETLKESTNFSSIFDFLCNDTELLFKDQQENAIEDLEEIITEDLFEDKEITIWNINFKTEYYRHRMQKVIQELNYWNLEETFKNIKDIYNKFISLELTEIKNPINRAKFLQDEFQKEIAERYIFAFDLDDTLLESNTKIHLVNEQGEKIESLWTKEYELALHNNPEKYNEKNWNLDFSDFSDLNKVIKGITNWKLNKGLVGFLNDIHSLGFKCIVVTARSHEKWVKIWLINIGLFDKFRYIYCVNSKENKYEDFLKWNFIKSSSDKKLQILKYYLESRQAILDKIIFFDDSPKHIKTISAYDSDKIKSIQID